jgi:DNA-binding MarR family transcriptional regulator
MVRKPEVSKADAATLTIARVARLLENATTADLSWSQYRVLGLLAEGDERASLLAGRLSLAKPTLTGVVDSLVDRAFVARSSSPDDRRVVELSITSTGRRALTTTATALREVLDDVLAHTDGPDRLLVALDDLGHGLDRRWAARHAAEVATR